MSNLQLVSPPCTGDMSADVTTLTDFLKYNETASVTDEENAVLQTTRQLSFLLSNIDVARMKAHELLEAETISASKLRYELNNLQKTFEAELAGATEAAEEYIALQKRNVQACVSDIKAAKGQVQRRQSELDLRNHDLALQSVNRERKYRDFIGDVNEIMTTRSKVKIHLNETEDELQLVRSKMKRCQWDRQQLEDMTEESRKDFEVEMNSLSTSLKEVKRLLAAGNEKKRLLTKSCDKLEEDATRAESTKAIAQKLLCEAISRLESELDLRKKFEVSILQARQEAEQLSVECIQMKHEYQSSRKHICSEEEQLIEQHRMIMRVVDEMSVEVNTLSAKQRLIQTALMKEMRLKDKHQSSLSAVKNSSASVKETLKYQSERGAELHNENRELDLRLKECSETFRIISIQLKCEIEKLTDDLKDRESHRARLEEGTDRLQQKILNLESELEQMTLKLKESEESNSRLQYTSEEKLFKLRGVSRKAEQQIQLLNQTLAEDTKQLQLFTETMQLQRQNYQENVKALNGSLLDQICLIEALEPQCLALENDHAQKVATYEEEKDSIITPVHDGSNAKIRSKHQMRATSIMENMHNQALTLATCILFCSKISSWIHKLAACVRNHRTTLKDSAKRLHHQLKVITDKQKLLRMEIIHQRTWTKDHFEYQTLHSSFSEAEVAYSEQHLQAILTENSHIYAATKDIYLECLWMKEIQRRFMMDNVELSKMGGDLAIQWGSDEKMEEKHRAYCDVVLMKTSLLSKQVEKRLKEPSPEQHVEERLP